VAAGGGTLAQFNCNHPELGGNGQWMSGGMTMVGDMFNYGLKATVSGLCSGAFVAAKFSTSLCSTACAEGGRRLYCPRQCLVAR
jgi:hypothetical protein